MNSKLLLLATIALLLTSFSTAQISPDLEDRLEERPDTDKVEAIILTEPGANQQARDAVNNADGNVSHDFNIIDGIAVEIPAVAAENLAERSFVREIQPDYQIETRLSESTDTVDAEEVWSENLSGEGVDVAVLDTGIEDNTILNVEDQVDYSGEGTDDLNGHGTHVAGIVASPDEEYRGVAYGADLFDVKVLDQDGTGSASDLIEGLDWAVENNVDIATLSLGAEVDECDGTSSLSEAVDNTVEEGITVTVAAGNNGPESETITAPGCSERGLTVGSSGDGEISDFSGRGPTADGRVKPDLVAPGEEITSLTNNDGDSPQFATLSGTSMATPHVAGAVALLLAEEGLTPAEVKNITTYTAEDLGAEENSQGSGRLDAYSAYQEVTTTNQAENETGNQPPTVEALETQVTLLNESAEAELTIDATDEDNETLNATFYLEGEEVNQQEGYGEMAYTVANLSLNSSYSWSAEVTDGINTTTTETQSFDTDVPTRENETEENNQTENRTGADLPPQASDTARKATAGFFNPTSPFYGFDLAFDRASVAVGLKTRESVMEERASEAVAMAERGNNRAAERAVSEMRKTAGNSENSSREAEETLNRTLQNAPEEAKQGLQNALRNVEQQRRERGQNQQRPESPVENRPDQGGDREQGSQDEQRPEEGTERSQNGEGRNTSDRETRQQQNPQRDQGTRQRENQEGEGNESAQSRNQEAEAETENGETNAEGSAEAGAEVGTESETGQEPDSGNDVEKGPGPGNSGNGGPVGNFFEAVLS